VVGLSAFGCAHTVVVEIPPKIDLQPYQTIGIVEFTSNTNGNLNQIATQKFMALSRTPNHTYAFSNWGRKTN